MTDRAIEIGGLKNCIVGPKDGYYCSNRENDYQMINLSLEDVSEDHSENCNEPYDMEDLECYQ